MTVTLDGILSRYETAMHEQICEEVQGGKVSLDDANQFILHFNANSIIQSGEDVVSVTLEQVPETRPVDLRGRFSYEFTTTLEVPFDWQDGDERISQKIEEAIERTIAGNPYDQDTVSISDLEIADVYEWF